MATDRAQLIDAQFNRAVEIIQGLPKTGPIQTGYEEKLTMYSLYKQATVGNVRSPRPGMWDMLGRAKWDAWAKHKDLQPLEAKWLYVDALMKVLRKYSEKTVARDLLQELEAFEGDGSDMGVLAHSGTLSRQTSGSNSSGSADSGRRRMQAALYPQQSTSHDAQLSRHPGAEGDIELMSEEEETDEDTDAEDPGPLPADTQHPGYHQQYPQQGMVQPQYTGGQRPPSSLSSAARYRTPMAASVRSLPGAGMSPPPPGGVPHTQPLPTFETPSAFPATVPTPGGQYPLTANHTGTTMQQARGSPAYQSASPQPMYGGPGVVVTRPRSNSSQTQSHLLHASRALPQQPATIPMQPTGGSFSTAARTPLERAIENMQAHIAALNERIDMLEAEGTFSSPSQYRSIFSFSARRERDRRVPGSGRQPFDAAHMGLWALLLNPLARIALQMERLFVFLTDADEEATYQPGGQHAHVAGRHGRRPRSPVLTIVRRLMLDISFVLFVLAVVRSAWRRSGVRRREVKAALGVLWRAIIGSTGVGASVSGQRRMVDQGV